MQRAHMPHCGERSMSALEDRAPVRTVCPPEGPGGQREPRQGEQVEREVRVPTSLRRFDRCVHPREQHRTGGPVQEQCSAAQGSHRS